MSKRGMTSMCMSCAGTIEQAATGRWKDYCSASCRQAAYRARRVTKRVRPSGFRNGVSA